MPTSRRLSAGDPGRLDPIFARIRFARFPPCIAATSPHDLCGLFAYAVDLCNINECLQPAPILNRSVHFPEKVKPRLVRRALSLGKTIGSLGYLISLGVVACWVVAVFFGPSLFFLMPRSAKLVTGSSMDGGDRFSASSEPVPWLLQSTSRLYRLAAPPPFESGQPMGGTGLVNDAATVGSENGDTVEVNQRSVRAEPTNAGMIDEPHNQALSVPAASGELLPAPRPENRAPAAARVPTSVQPSQTETSRTKHSQKAVANKPPSTHPPVQAIQDVLQRHAGLLK